MTPELDAAVTSYADELDLAPNELRTRIRRRMAYRARHAAAVTKTCPRCELVLPASAFGSNRARRDGLQAVCRPCRSAS